MSLTNFNFPFIIGVFTILSFPLLAQERNLQQNILNNLMSKNSELIFDMGKIETFMNEANSSETIPNQKIPSSENSESLQKTKWTMTGSEATENLPAEFLSNIEKYYALLIPAKLPIFGQRSFSVFENSAILHFNTIGNEYKLAPGDVLQVTVRGINQFDKTIQVSVAGSIVLPKLVPINVEGLTLKEVEKKIFDLIKFDDSSAFVNIALEAARLVPVQITGAARHPQTIAVPAYTPLSRILPLVGGIQNDGSFRNITMIGSSNEIKEIDLYSLLRGSKKFDDPLIRSATRIHINDIGLTVAVSGFVGRPGIFELPKKIKAIKAKELLELANAKMIPPGALIEILKINSNGVIEKHKVANIESQTVYAGEVLNVELPVTSNINKISVQGAVLEEYQLNGDSVKSLAEVLKYGATLREDSLLDFAIIKPKLTAKKPPRSVDLRFAFENPEKVLINPGETVVIITPNIYRLILASDETPLDRLITPIETDDILTSSNQNRHTKAKDINLSKPVIVSNVTKELKESKVSKVSDALRSFLALDELLRVTRRIYIDNKLLELIPDLPNNLSIKTTIDRINIPSNLNLDFALKIEDFGQTDRKIISFSPKEKFNNSQKNDFFSSKGIKSSIKLYSNSYLKSTLTTNEVGKVSNVSNDLKSEKEVAKAKIIAKAEIEISQPVKIYVDGKLSYIISKNISFGKSSAFNRVKADPNIYPLFIRETRLKNSTEWVTPPPHYSSLMDMTNERKNLSKIEMFTHEFVRGLFEDERINLSNILEEEPSNNIDLTQIESNQMGSNQMGSNQMGLNQMGSNQMGLNQMGLNQMGLNRTNEENRIKSIKKKEFEHFTAFKRNSKLITGALEKPGFYPIIGAVTLEDLISTSGGLLPGADLENVTIREYKNNNGETTISGTQYIDISSIPPRKVLLDGHFTVYIPYLINNADIGTIEIDGEISHPGTYTFSRNETLEEVLDRAGGFTETAYPLGASFHRESLKSEQRLSNANLAREVEQSILFLSQSQLSGAGDQIKAIVAYANQLKNMPATGKQVLNIEGASRTMLLEDGDKLYIPKRPSHVTITGSVQNPVTTIYRTNKTLESYIAEAGGLKRIADKKNVFIMLPGGRNTTQSSLQKEGSFIPAGSVIVVPPKTDKISALGLTDIWSRVLGNIATSILAINAATK